MRLWFAFVLFTVTGWTYGSKLLFRARTKRHDLSVGSGSPQNIDFKDDAAAEADEKSLRSLLEPLVNQKGAHIVMEYMSEYPWDFLVFLYSKMETGQVRELLERDPMFTLSDYVKEYLVDDKTLGTPLSQRFDNVIFIYLNTNLAKGAYFALKDAIADDVLQAGLDDRVKFSAALCQESKLSAPPSLGQLKKYFIHYDNVLENIVLNDNLPLFISLLRAGVSINAHSAGQETPIAWAIRYSTSGKRRTLDFILERDDVDYDVISYSKCSLIHIAVNSHLQEQDKRALLVHLVDRGVDVDIINKHGRTAAHIAFARGDINCLQFLLFKMSKGALQKFKCNPGSFSPADGRVVSDEAARARLRDMMKLIERAKKDAGRKS